MRLLRLVILAVVGAGCGSGSAGNDVDTAPVDAKMVLSTEGGSGTPQVTLSTQ